MKKKKAFKILRYIIVAVFFILSYFFAFENNIGFSVEGHDGKNRQTDNKNQQVQVPAPPLSEDIFPCSVCHEDLEVDRQRRELTEHTDIKFEHDKEHRWCLDCHDADNRDMLRQASGVLTNFEDSYLLCGQCHGPKLRDWRAGVHGKRSGYWDGQKRYLLCVHCHDPHSPRFRAIKPEPPHVRPENLRKKIKETT